MFHGRDPAFHGPSLGPQPSWGKDDERLGLGVVWFEWGKNSAGECLETGPTYGCWIVLLEVLASLEWFR